MGESPGEGRVGVSWPKGLHTTFLMAGNHEQIDGMNGLVYHGYTYSGQKTNYGAWLSDHWRFVALDTGYRCMHLRANGSRDTGDSGETDAPQPEVVVEWLSQTLNLNNVSDNRGIVIMTHHQPYSDFERAYLGTALQLQKILPKNRTVLWLFGHEHRFALYDKLRLNDTWNCKGSVSHFVSDFSFYPRMVGYGGYRDSPKAPKRKDRPWKLKAWDQRVYQEIPNDDDKNLQALGYNGYFKIVARMGRNDQKICDRSS